MAALTRLVGFVGTLSGKGKFIGKAKNGIMVFRKTAKDGTVVTNSYKKGKLFKSITQERYTDSRTNAFVPRETKGVKTTAVNHETGITTYSNNAIVRYPNAFSQYGQNFKAGTVRREFDVCRTMKLNGKEVECGVAYGRVSAPNFLHQMTRRNLTNGSYIQTDISKNGYSIRKYITTQNYEMPNGNTVTGCWGRIFHGPQKNGVSVYWRGHNLSMTPQSNGTYAVKG